MPPALGIFSRSGLPYGAYANGFTQITKAFLENPPDLGHAVGAARHGARDLRRSRHGLGRAGAPPSSAAAARRARPHIAEIARRLREAGLHD